VAKYKPENIDAHLCTHIVYSFAKIVNGVLANYEWNDDGKLYGTGAYGWKPLLKFLDAYTLVHVFSHSYFINKKIPVHSFFFW